MKQRSKWFIFVLVAIAQFMVVLDVAITNVALPTIRHELHFAPSALQWVITAYALSFGGFLLLGGRAADLFGRRRMLLAGMAGFTLLSFLIGISRSPVELVGLRALQGLAAAMMSPAALSIVLVTFQGNDRNKALSYWTLVATGGAAVGLLLGGLLTQYFGWRWDFFVNVPVGIIMAYLIRRHVPLHEQEEKQKQLDLPGAVLVTSSLMIQVFAFSQAPQWGWLHAKTLATFGIAIVLLLGFLANEARAKRPLMPLSIFTIRNVVGANAIMAPVYAGMLGIFFLTTLYLQTILHYRPFTTGLAFLPFPIVLGFVSTRMPKLVHKFGYRRFLIAGPLLVGASLLWLARVPAGGNYLFTVLPTFLVMPIGVGMTFMPTIAAATSGVPAHESGLASGLISTSQQMGGALGLAVLSSVAAAVTAGAIHTGAVPATLHGFHVAYVVAVLFMIVAASVAALVIRQKQAQPAAVHAAAE